MTEGAPNNASSLRIAEVFEQVALLGPQLKKIAKRLNLTVGQVAGIKRYHRQGWDLAHQRFLAAQLTAGDADASARPAAEKVSDQRVTRRAQNGEIEVRAEGSKIKTVEDLLAYIEADLEKYEVAMQESTMWEVGTKNPVTGEVTTTQLHRVYVKLKQKAGPGILEAVNTLLDTAFRERTPPAIHVLPKTRGDIWQVLNIADPHFGKYAWAGNTGGADYDLGIARDHVLSSSLELLARGNMDYHPAFRTIGLLGDIMHYDTPNGTTTSGTHLDRDSRLQKMVDVATDTIIAVIEASAESCPTEVVLVNGNHDEALSWAFQKTLAVRFRNDARVMVDATFTSRKYRAYGGNLVGWTHGDKAKRRLPQLMAIEAKQEWGKASYYEIHTGHTHSTAAEWQRPIETVDGVVVRVSPAICPPDSWHYEQGFVGSPRAMESFFYRQGGGVIGSITTSPDYRVAASRIKAA